MITSTAFHHAAHFTVAQLLDPTFDPLHAVRLLAQAEADRIQPASSIRLVSVTIDHTVPPWEGMHLVTQWQQTYAVAERAEPEPAAHPDAVTLPGVPRYG